MNSMPRPDVSTDFTMDDIHKIRAWNYERRKGMTTQERLDDINNGALEFIAHIEAARHNGTYSAMLDRSVRQINEGHSEK